MERKTCVILEDNILEFLDEIENQLGKGIICCKCKNPCEKNTKCAMAMKNLLTDIGIFIKAYLEVNPKESKQTESEEPIIQKQILND